MTKQDFLTSTIFFHRVPFLNLKRFISSKATSGEFKFPGVYSQLLTVPKSYFRKRQTPDELTLTLSKLAYVMMMYSIKYAPVVAAGRHFHGYLHK